MASRTTQPNGYSETQAGRHKRCAYRQVSGARHYCHDCMEFFTMRKVNQ